jgi:isopentenyldiphosphate isomerase/intracellular septation protein A
MGMIELFKKMLPGLIPLLIFILADEIWGTEIGLIVAVSIGIIQLIYFALKEKKLEKFVLFDTLLIIGMGGISIALHDDIFFKLKPVVIEAILVAILAFSLYSKHNLMLSMSKRYLQGVEINSEQEKMMRRNLTNMLVILSLHLLLSLYACFWMSTKAWAFITTGLFYLLMIGYFGLEFIIRFFKNRHQEYLPLVDVQGKVIGKATRKECHRNPDLLYPVVRLHLFNRQGELLLQKRSFKSDIEAGKWDAAIAGHVQFGEDIETALRREAKEELNLSNLEFQLVNQRLFKSPNTSALMFLFVGKIDYLPKINKKEVEEVAFFKMESVPALFSKELASNGLKEEFPIIKTIRFNKA